jgi:hypothetical protein
MASKAEIVESFRTQAEWGRRLGSPFMARLMARAAEQIERGGTIAAAIGDWPGDPNVDALPLRFAGALHALVLAGADAELAALYPPRGESEDIDRLWRAVEQAVAARPEHFAAYLALPPQTNEVGRSALLLPAFGTVAQATGLPLRLLEIGASAGLNLNWDHYHFDYGAARWGDPTSPVELVCEWRGQPAALPATIAVASRAACDRDPIDLADEAQRQRLRSYIWLDQRARLERLDGAIALARAATIRVERADAADWLEARLAEPAPGAATVLYQSVVLQYLPAPARARIRAMLAAAGARATRQSPLAHVSLEFAPDSGGYELRLTLWPGGGERTARRLAVTHPHGAWLDWLGVS